VDRLLQPRRGADGGPDDGPIDSVDHWAALVSGAEDPPPRSEVLLAGIDTDKRGAAIRAGDYKLLVGTWGSGAWCDLNRSGYSPFYPVPPGNASQGLAGGEGGLWCAPSLGGGGGGWPSVTPVPTGGLPPPLEADDDVAAAAAAPPWWEAVAGLYDVVSDPREQHDLQHKLPEVVERLQARLRFWNASTASTAHLPADPAGAAHAKQTGCWSPWK
jgi:hypothetical protein